MLNVGGDDGWREFWVAPIYRWVTCCAVRDLDVCSLGHVTLHSRAGAVREICDDLYVR